MRLTVVGCGDAFGSGGRLQTCFHISAQGTNVLLDCGATALIGMERCGLDPALLSTIFITHLHGDHFAGLVWWLIHARYILRRAAPLVVTGPKGLEERVLRTAEALFPSSTEGGQPFELRFVEYTEGVSETVGPWRVTPFEVRHPSGAPSCALRLECGGKTLAFTGDTEWVPNLPQIGSDADLFIMECFGYEQPARYHLSWREIAANLDRLSARRILLTHMGPAMLANRAKISAPRVSLAADGMVLDI